MSYYPGQARTSRHLTWALLFTIGIGLTVSLYYVKTRAQSSKNEAARLERVLAEEQAALNVLRAEIAYLESPDRVGALARAELGLERTSTQQVMVVGEIEQRFPLIAQAPQ